VAEDMVSLIKTKSERYTSNFGLNKAPVEKNSDEVLVDQN